jgi:hypothetical protein
VVNREVSRCEIRRQEIQRVTRRSSYTCARPPRVVLHCLSTGAQIRSPGIRSSRRRQPELVATSPLVVLGSADLTQALCGLTYRIESAIQSQGFRAICRMKVAQIGRRRAGIHDSDPTHAYTMPCEGLYNALGIRTLLFASNLDVQ